MNKVTRTTLGGRIRAAWKALRGKPVGCINFGLRVIRCDECERGNCADCILKARDNPLRWVDDGPDTVCPVCGYSCNDEYYLGKGNFCPDCGQRLQGLHGIMEGEK